jgi:ABC-2 type transport system permease protein
MKSAETAQVLSRPPRQVYVALLLAQIQHEITYPLGILIDLFTSLLSVAAVYSLWRTVFATQPQLAGFDWPQMQTYVILSNALFALLGATTMRQMMNAIRTGAVVAEVVRPYSYIVGQCAQAIGRVLTQGTIGGLTIVLLGFAWIGMATPGSPAGVCLFLVSLGLSLLTSLLLNCLFALLCFWTKDSEGLIWAYGALMFIFSGGMAPIALLPAWLQLVAYALPFQSLIAAPLSIYRGSLSGSELSAALGLQIAWVGLLMATVRQLWRHALHVAELPGG